MSNRDDGNKLLDELYELTLLEAERNLTEEETTRYIEIVDYCNENNIPIEFGIEI